MTILTFEASKVFPSFFFEDDAFFYLNIAYNLANYGVSSFDTINITNGYHPLWLGVLSSIAWGCSLITSSKAAFIILCLIFSNSLVYAISFLLIKQRQFQWLFFIACYYVGFTMEGIILSLFIILLFQTIDQGSPKLSIIAFCCFFIPLARIDSSILPLSFAFLCVAKKHKPTKVENIIFISTVLGICSNLILQKIGFGYFYTVSSYYKAISMGPSDLISIFKQNIMPTGNLIRFSIIASVILLWIKTSTKKIPRFTPLFIILISLGYLGIHLFSNHLRDWYFAIPILLSIAVVDREIKISSYTKYYLNTLNSLLVLAIGFYIFIHWEDQKNSKLFIDKVNNLVDHEDKIYQINGSGFTGFWLQAPVINGDGLVNSFEYLELVSENKLGNYIDDQHICWLIIKHPIQNDTIIDFHGLNIKTSDVSPVITSSKTYNEFANFQLLKFNSCIN